MWGRREIVVAISCLAVGSTGQLVQYLVTPVSESGSAKDNVAKALAHPAAMQWPGSWSCGLPVSRWRAGRPDRAPSAGRARPLRGSGRPGE